MPPGRVLRAVRHEKAVGGVGEGKSHGEQEASGKLSVSHGSRDSAGQRPAALSEARRVDVRTSQGEQMRRRRNTPGTLGAVLENPEKTLFYPENGSGCNDAKKEDH